MKCVLRVTCYVVVPGGGVQNLGAGITGGYLSRPVSPKLAHEAVLAKPPCFNDASAQWLSKMRLTGVQNVKIGDWGMGAGDSFSSEFTFSSSAILWSHVICASTSCTIVLSGQARAKPALNIPFLFYLVEIGQVAVKVE